MNNLDGYTTTVANMYNNVLTKLVNSGQITQTGYQLLVNGRNSYIPELCNAIPHTHRGDTVTIEAALSTLLVATASNIQHQHQQQMQPQQYMQPQHRPQQMAQPYQQMGGQQPQGAPPVGGLPQVAQPVPVMPAAQPTPVATIRGTKQTVVTTPPVETTLVPAAVPDTGTTPDWVSQPDMIQMFEIGSSDDSSVEYLRYPGTPTDPVLYLCDITHYANNCDKYNMITILNRLFKHKDSVMFAYIKSSKLARIPLAGEEELDAFQKNVVDVAASKIPAIERLQAISEYMELTYSKAACATIESIVCEEANLLIDARALFSSAHVNIKFGPVDSINNILIDLNPTNADCVPALINMSGYAKGFKRFSESICEAIAGITVATGDDALIKSYLHSPGKKRFAEAFEFASVTEDTDEHTSVLRYPHTYGVILGDTDKLVELNKVNSFTVGANGVKLHDVVVEPSDGNLAHIAMGRAGHVMRIYDALGEQKFILGQTSDGKQLYTN